MVHVLVGRDCCDTSTPSVSYTAPSIDSEYFATEPIAQLSPGACFNLCTCNMALSVRTQPLIARSTRTPTLSTPLLPCVGGRSRPSAHRDQLLTNRPSTALNAYNPVKSGRGKASKQDDEQHWTLTTQPPRNKREVAEGVWTYILLGGLLFSGMLFVLPEFSMAIPLIFKAFGGQ